jgi:K+-sensing histidine kinase KdpD
MSMHQEVRVGDHGPGVLPHEQAMIFQSFCRVGDIDEEVSSMVWAFTCRASIRAHGTIGSEARYGQATSSARASGSGSPSRRAVLRG